MVVGHRVHVDADLGQVRAFVAAADQLHFGRAAAELFLTQQALSKRIQRLERLLGAPLFARTGRSVRLTGEGERLLPYARDLLTTAAAAERAVHALSPPLRIDVWGQVQAPLRIVRELSGDLAVALSMRRSSASSITALLRGELDLAFVAVPECDAFPMEELATEEIYREPMALLVNLAHPLADRELCTADDLRAAGVWWPDVSSTPEIDWYVHRLAEAYGAPVTIAGSNLGFPHVIQTLHADPGRATVMGADWPLDGQPGVRRIPLHPVPRFPWSMAWRRRDRNPRLAAFVLRLRRTARQRGWLESDPERDWLPAPLGTPTLSGGEVAAGS
jgi:DNA-binding transcriptional LysR family regulator